jgi:nucleoside diphosphate kinase
MQELAYAIITPYTIMKSRTGAVLARLFGRVSSTLVASQMFAPGREFARQVAESIQRGLHEDDERLRSVIRDYVRDNFAPDHNGRLRRLLMLVFRGENAVADVAQVTGHLRISASSGETIRDAYGDLIWNPDGTVRYFEPAVLIADTPENALRDLEMWAGYARSQPSILENVCHYGNPGAVQQALTLIKPDSWRQKSPRPGAIVDMFSRTGLRIIGCLNRANPPLQKRLAVEGWDATSAMMSSQVIWFSKSPSARSSTARSPGDLSSAAKGAGAKQQTATTDHAMRVKTDPS